MLRHTLPRISHLNKLGPVEQVLPSDPAYRIGEYLVAVFSSRPCDFRVKVSQSQYTDDAPYLRAQRAQAVAYAGIRQFIARADHRRRQCKGGGNWRALIDGAQGLVDAVMMVGVVGVVGVVLVVVVV
eukprot:3363270-Rhodomonas_salina.2